MDYPSRAGGSRCGVLVSTDASPELRRPAELLRLTARQTTNPGLFFPYFSAANPTADAFPVLANAISALSHPIMRKMTRVTG